jgi:photosystem II cytochrome c550
MVKRLIWVAVATVFLFFQVHVNSAAALKLDEATRTVTLNEEGETVVLSSQEITKGERIFNDACTQCHLQGKTKTNNNVSLGLKDLSKAVPRRDNVAALVEYLKQPMSYDGEYSLELEHPNVTRPDVWPELKNLNEKDIFNVAGYMLVAPKLDDRWGGTIYF